MNMSSILQFISADVAIRLGTNKNLQLHFAMTKRAHDKIEVTHFPRKYDILEAKKNMYKGICIRMYELFLAKEN